MYTREDTIRSDRGSELGRKTVGFQDPVSDMDQVVDVRMQHAFTKAVLDQLEANGTDVRRHHRKLRKSNMLLCLQLNIAGTDVVSVGIQDQWVHIKPVIRMNNFEYLNLGLLKYGSNKMYHGLPMKKLNIRIV